MLHHLNGASPDSDEPATRRLVERVITDARYEGYIARQRAQVRRQIDSDRQRIPDCYLLGCSRSMAIDAVE